MKSTIAILSASMAAAVLAHPLDARSQQCNVAPSAATNAKIKPIAQPSAATADACLDACLSNPACKSFIFGLPANVDVPVCELFSVPAAQVPSQGSELYVFDKACSESAVPNTAPTHTQPRGQINRKRSTRSLVCNAAPSGPADSSIQPIATPTVKTAEECQEKCVDEAKCQSFLFGLPADASAPLCKLFEVPPAKVPVRDDELYVFAKGCAASEVPTTAPTHDEPRGEAPSGNTADKDNSKTSDSKNSGSDANTNTNNAKAATGNTAAKDNKTQN
ncbi:hypothetical protein LRP88_11165 [Fusarium phalaenopsidis]|nr:hypothetical protein NCS56_01434300 [Fusarium sp. Ph1]